MFENNFDYQTHFHFTIFKFAENKNKKKNWYQLKSNDGIRIVMAKVVSPLHAPPAFQ